MSLHLSGLYFLGMAPKGLICSRGGERRGSEGSARSRPSSISRWRYADMMSGRSYADFRFRAAALYEAPCCHSNSEAPPDPAYEEVDKRPVWHGGKGIVPVVRPEWG